MTNDEKRKFPWTRNRDEGVSEGEEVTITEDDVGTIEVDDEGVARVPGQEPPVPTEDDVGPMPEHPVEQERPIDPMEAVDPEETVRVVRVIEMVGTAGQVREMLGRSWLEPGETKATGRDGSDVVLTETERHYLKEGDYVVTMLRNRAKDG